MLLQFTYSGVVVFGLLGSMNSSLMFSWHECKLLQALYSYVYFTQLPEGDLPGPLQWWTNKVTD